MNLAEFDPMDARPMGPQLEQAVNEIRNETVDDAVVEAAAQRVWARLEAAARPEHLRTCADFQALIPDYRAGRLPEARATLLKDHLHECVACRKVYEGRVVAMPVPAKTARPAVYPVRWAVAAVVVLAVGASTWYLVEGSRAGGGRASVQSVTGTLYELRADGLLHPLQAGQNLPDGVEVRTAADSDAMLQLRDGSVVELRERSGMAASSEASDLTIRLSRGSIIVQAAKRRQGHLYVATSDCRVAVTGTVFSVVSGVKGSRVSVVEGEVHVAQDNQDHVLHPGDQLSTSTNLEPGSVRDDIGWSRNRDHLMQQLDRLRSGLQQIHLPALRYSSKLLDRLPADTMVFGSIPNLGHYLAEAQAVFEANLAQSPELRAWWDMKGSKIGPLVEKLRAASEYLGDEIVVVSVAGPNGHPQAPVFLAGTTRPGFSDFVRKTVPQASVVERSGMVAFGPEAAAVESMMAAVEQNSGGFKGTPLYGRIAEAYRNGAGMLVAADVSQLPEAGGHGVRYFMAEQKEVRNQMEMRATAAFNGQQTGFVSWLAEPAPMGSLDYVSPDAQFVTGFVVKQPGAIIDQLVPVAERLIGSANAPENSAALRNDIAASLGGEFSLSFDGPIFPPSWKLVAEVYDPARAQAAIQKAVDAFNRKAAEAGAKPLRTSSETVEGRTYYMIAAADPNPLTEGHYTFADGYLIAGPTRALVSKALQLKLSGTSITHSAKFFSMEPSDHYANYSGLLYANLGNTLAPLAGLLGSLAPQGGHGENPLAKLGNLKPMLLAAYAHGDEITVAGSGNLLGNGISNAFSGNLAGMVGNLMPMGQMQGVGRRR
jgi:FecR protein/Putative zinc-finger